ncbi:MAG: UTP--glucose-1-phosphate uridylyltransferase [Chloroflexi bacterium]|nr:UTP--glucose-1-phosphate uridylyltransferase [Chloroflexota bacterium]
MGGYLTRIITSTDPAIRDLSLDAYARSATLSELLDECAGLDRLRQTSPNLYERVRACFFLYALNRFHIPQKPKLHGRALVPFAGYDLLLRRRYEEAIDVFMGKMRAEGPSDSLASALAASYHGLGFQILADQVRRSVRSVRGNQWMFRMGHPADHPLRIRPELLRRETPSDPYPLLRERTPVRMDLSHSGWSDIFFLGMDYPEGARVLNISIDLGVLGRDPAPRPPVEAYIRVIDEPLIRLASVDLGVTAEISQLDEIFDYAKDYLGLLKAALIASGIVPPGVESSDHRLADLLARVVGPGLGLELVSCVNGIPKGSRLAVSTTLLAALIAICMRATGQTRSLCGVLHDDERQLVAARAILGEWLAGSGGGWQDSGGIWPGIKLIQGVLAQKGDPEYGISRGCLLPSHHIMSAGEVSPATRQALQDSLVLVHGGMAQNVGPILEMVTEKYLLRSDAEWLGRHEACQVFERIVSDLKSGDVRAIGAETTHNFEGPIQAIIPWASNLYTETLISRVRREFQERFWGFWMLGGMSGGGMGFIFDPSAKAAGQRYLQETMSTAKRELEQALPFAMEPVVYHFGINERGTYADLLLHDAALLPGGYYATAVPALLRYDRLQLTPARRAELDKFGAACRTRPELAGMVQTLFDRLLPRPAEQTVQGPTLEEALAVNGFDRLQHEQIRADLRSGRIGLAQNRLSPSTAISDVLPGDVADAEHDLMPECVELGCEALRGGQVAVVTLAGGIGSRWTQGAGVVKALHPFARLGGLHRSFIEVHLAKSRHTNRTFGVELPHIITTSYLTHEPIATYLQRVGNYGYAGPLLLSSARAVGLRLIPTARDLHFAWEEMPQQMLDEQAQKVRESLHAALFSWAHQMGEAGDYTDNVPLQCLHPVGHWFEVPNLLKNGVLRGLLDERPQLRYLMLHNIDTLGANADPAFLGWHIQNGAGMTVEVIARRLEDRGGGLARINGQLRLVEGLAMPREQDEFNLTYYNSATMWLDIDQLLAAFGLDRAALVDETRVTEAVRKVAARMPTYMTLKDVKKRWGQGQEDIYPVLQWEKLWGDMTGLPELRCSYLCVPRLRGQQLKEQAQLDGWLRDGSAAYIETLCDW